MTNHKTKFDSILDRVDAVLTGNRRWLPALIVASFALKLIYVFQSAGATHVTVPIMDSEYYLRMAQDILGGRVVRDEAFFMGPLYPYVLSIVLGVFGKSIMAVRIVQALAGAVTVLMTYLLGKELLRPSVALLGAALLALYGAVTFYEGQLLMMWLGTLLNVSMLYVLVRRRGGMRAYAIAGLLLGLSALARANILLVLVVLIPWVLFLSGERRRWRATGVLVTMLVLTILPATIHNYLASRDFVPITSNGGVNFYIGNNEDATGIFAPPKGINLVTDDAVRTYVERVLGKPVTPSELSRYWFTEAFHFIRTQPGAAAALLLRKTALYFNGYEVPQIESYDIARSRYGSLRLLFVNLWMLLSLGLMGMLFALRDWKKYFLLYGYIMAFSLSIILFFVTSRYRVQMSPVLVLFAAQALLTVVPGAIANVRHRLSPLIVLVVLVLVTNPSLFALAEGDVLWREYTHEARRLSKIGKHGEALAEINKAIEIHPDYADSYIHRALIQKAAGKHLEVVEDYARAIDLNPNLPTVQYDFGQALRQLKMYEPAIEAYRKAIELNPLMLEAYNNLGFTYRQLHRYDEASRQFEKVIDMDPRYVKAYNNLGASLAESGDLDRAIDTFVRGISVDPSYANTYKNLAMAYIQKKDVPRAYDLLQKYLSLQPDDQQAAGVLEQLRVVIEGDTLQGR